MPACLRVARRDVVHSLTELPHELGELPLQFLNISYNKLTWLPASIMERHPST